MLFLEEALEGPFWEQIVFGNSMTAYAEALVIFFVALVVLKLVQVVVIARLRRLSKKTKTGIDDLFVAMADAVRPSFYVVVSIYVALRALTLSSVVGKALNVILLIWVVYQVIVMTQKVIDFVVRKRLETKEGAENAARVLGGIVKFVLWTLGLLLILQNMGVNVTSLIAGIGVGGIAIAFALQKILEDLFSSFAIYFDKPFEVGDTIKIGEYQGDVEKIGIKSTRIRSVHGEEIVMANKELTTATLQNFRRLDERRATLKFGVLYETPEEKLEKIPEMVREEIEKASGVRPHREHFVSFGDSALDFQVTYFVESDEYENFLNAQQSVNLAIHKRFKKEGIEMAYPTRTIYMQK